MRSVSTALTVFAFLACGFIQSQTASLKERSVDERKVTLDVVVSPGLLSSSAIQVLDGGVAVAPERVHVLSPQEEKNGQVQVLFVIDAVNSSFQDVTRSEEAIKAILKESKPPLAQLTSIVVVSDRAATNPTTMTSGTQTTALDGRKLFAHRVAPSRNPSDLVKGLEEYKVGLHRILQSQDGPGQAERVRISLQALSFLAKAITSEPGPKVVLWIGPGWPFLAKSAGQSSEQLFDSVIYFADLLRSARVILYSVSPEGLTSQDHSAETEAFLLSSRPGSIQANGYAPRVPLELTPTYYKEFLESPRSAAASNPNDLALQVLAVQSGGVVMQQNNDLRGQLVRCLADAANISTLVYEPLVSDRTEAFHSVQVRRLGNSTILRTRTGYYTR